VRSATNSPASRSIAIATIRLARRSASARLTDHLVDQGALGFLAGKAGHGLELAAGFVNQAVTLGFLVGEVLFARAHALVAAVKIGLAPLERFLAFLERFFARFQFRLRALQLAPAVADFALRVGARLNDHILCLDLRFLDD
jgi:hypothetical protein